VPFRFFKNFCYILVSLQSFEKLLYFFQTPKLGGGNDFLLTRHLFHINQFFTVPKDNNLDLTR